MVVGQSHGFETVDNLMHIGTAHDGQIDPVLVMVGQCVLAGCKPSAAGAAAAWLRGCQDSESRLRKGVNIYSPGRHHQEDGERIQTHDCR